MRRRTLPPPRILRHAVLTAGVTWLCLRGGLALLHAGRLGWRAAVLVALVPAIVAWFDLRVLRERTLLGNLGQTEGGQFLAGLLTAGVLESLTQLGWRVLGMPS